MKSVKQSAQHREHIAHVHAQIFIKAHKAHADNTYHCCADIIFVRLFTENQPVQKRHKNTVSRSQECIFARRCVHKPICLHGVCRCEAYSHQHSALYVLSIELFEHRNGCKQHDECSSTKAYGQHPQRRYTVKRRLEHDKGSAPNESRADKRRPSQHSFIINFHCLYLHHMQGGGTKHQLFCNTAVKTYFYQLIVTHRGHFNYLPITESAVSDPIAHRERR